MKIIILDYGSGNVGSLSNILKFLDYNFEITSKEEKIIEGTHFILPGVGAFNSVMEKIKKKLPLDVLCNQILIKKKPLLGICVGMQVLAEFGYENGKHEGLGFIKGSVKRMDSESILPHVGWNNIEINYDSPLFNDMDELSDFYFVHSYVFRSSDELVSLAKTQYNDTTFTSVIGKGNILGVQFHPEKSQDVGKLLVRNFIEYFS